MCFGVSACGCLSFPDPASERRAGEQDPVPTPAELTSPSRAAERRAKDDSRRVVRSAQDLSNVSMDEVGIPLRVRMWTIESPARVYDVVCEPLGAGAGKGLQ